MLSILDKVISFRKNIHYYLLVFLLFSSLLGAIVFSVSVNRHQKMKRIQNYMDTAVTELDLTLQEKLYDFLNINLNHYIKQSTFGDFFTVNSTDSQFFTTVRASAIDSIRLEKDFKNLILYRTADSALLSTLSTRSDFSEYNPAFPYITAALSNERRVNPCFLSVGTEVFYYYPLLDSSSSRELVGCALVKLRSPKEFFHINVEDLNEKGTFLILNGNEIVSVEGYNILSNGVIEAIIHNSPPADRIFTYHNADIPPYDFYYADSAASKLRYVYYEPAYTGLAALPQLGRENWFMPFLFVCSSTILFFLISIWLVFKMEHVSSDTPEESVTELSSFFDSNLTCWSGILCEYHSKREGEELTEEQLALMTASCEQYLSGCQIAYHITPQNSVLCCYINYSVYNLRVLCDSLKQTLYNTLGECCDFNIYYTDTLPSCSEMLEQTKQLTHQLRYTQVYGYGARFSLSILQLCENSSAAVDPDFSTMMQKYLSEKKYDALIDYLEKQKKKIISGFRNPPDKMHYSYNAVYSFMENLFFALKTHYQEKSFSHPITELNTVTVISQHTGIERFCDYLIESIQSCKAVSEQSCSSHEQQLMDAVYLYIEQNLDSVTLNSMAEHFHITSAHLSRLFKKNAEKNFSEYLSDKKLQKAILLLEQDSNSSINDISKLLGYSTSAYFLTKFKERYGMTPSAYRKSFRMRAEGSV